MIFQFSHDFPMFFPWFPMIFPCFSPWFSHFFPGPHVQIGHPAEAPPVAPIPGRQRRVSPVGRASEATKVAPRLPNDMRCFNGDLMVI
jgi:hypothetical protein